MCNCVQSVAVALDRPWGCAAPAAASTRGTTVTTAMFRMVNTL